MPKVYVPESGDVPEVGDLKLYDGTWHRITHVNRVFTPWKGKPDQRTTTERWQLGLTPATKEEIDATIGAHDPS